MSRFRSAWRLFGWRQLGRVAMLERGQSTFLDLNGDDFAITVHWRAVVTVLPPGPIDNALPPGPIVPAEVINNANGRTAFVLSTPPSVRSLPLPVGD